MVTTDQHIIFFDGVCNLCNSSVQFVINRDPSHYFSYAPLQGEAAKEHLKETDQAGLDLSSVVLMENGVFYDRSTAALRIARHLSGAWPVLYGFIIIPKFLRDAVYNFIARNRYKWFGKQESCMIPTPELKQLFLD